MYTPLSPPSPAVTITVTPGMVDSDAQGQPVPTQCTIPNCAFAGQLHTRCMKSAMRKPPWCKDRPMGSRRREPPSPENTTPFTNNILASAANDVDPTEYNRYLQCIRSQPNWHLPLQAPPNWRPSPGFRRGVLAAAGVPLPPPGQPNPQTPMTFINTPMPMTMPGMMYMRTPGPGQAQGQFLSPIIPLAGMSPQTAGVPFGFPHVQQVVQQTSTMPPGTTFIATPAPPPVFLATPAQAPGPAPAGVFHSPRPPTLDLGNDDDDDGAHGQGRRDTDGLPNRPPDRLSWDGVNGGRLTWTPGHRQRQQSLPEPDSNAPALGLQFQSGTPGPDAIPFRAPTPVHDPPAQAHVHYASPPSTPSSQPQSPPQVTVHVQHPQPPPQVQAQAPPPAAHPPTVHVQVTPGPAQHPPIPQGTPGPIPMPHAVQMQAPGPVPVLVQAQAQPQVQVQSMPPSPWNAWQIPADGGPVAMPPNPNFTPGGWTPSQFTQLPQPVQVTQVTQVAQPIQDVQLQVQSPAPRGTILLAPWISPNPRSASIPHMMWDVAEHPSRIKRLTSRGCVVAFAGTDAVGQQATYPGVSQMHIYIPGMRNAWGPLIIERPSTSGPIEVGMIFDALYNYLQTPLGNDDIRSLLSSPDGEAKYARVEYAFYRRCRRSLAVDGYERSQGMKRVDVLEGSSMFWGMWANYRGDGTWYVCVGFTAPVV